MSSVSAESGELEAELLQGPGPGCDVVCWAARTGWNEKWGGCKMRLAGGRGASDELRERVHPPSCLIASQHFLPE